MKKRFVSAALAAVMALSMTACGSSNSAAETTAADTEAAESQAEETTAEEAKTASTPDLTWSWHRKLQNVWVWNIRHSRLPGILKIWSLSPAISTASGMDLR